MYSDEGNDGERMLVEGVGGGNGFRSAAVTRLIMSPSSSFQTNGRAETQGRETYQLDSTQYEERQNVRSTNLAASEAQWE